MDTLEVYVIYGYVVSIYVKKSGDCKSLEPIYIYRYIHTLHIYNLSHIQSSHNGRYAFLFGAIFLVNRLEKKTGYIDLLSHLGP